MANLKPDVAGSGSSTVRILAGKLFDSFRADFLSHQLIIVSRDTGRILAVEEYHESAQVDIDLQHLTVLPGFVDAHVHFFLHSYDETSWTDQLTKESLVERTVRATNHARDTLMAGFTTVRDLGTEGAEDADLHLRKCMSGPNPLIPGPRYFCANRAIVATGSYGPRSAIHLNQEGIEGIMGAEIADGKDECIKAVRRQVGTGADWVKIYADYRVRSRMGCVSSHLEGKSLRTFSDEELEVMVKTAKQLGVKVAVHASTAAAVDAALAAGVDTIEHGNELGLSEQTLNRFIASPQTTWVPTLSVFYKIYGPNHPGFQLPQQSFQQALKANMTNIAVGGDTGAFPHGENALELKLMVRLGAPWKTVLKWATLGGWQCVRPVNWEEVQDGTGDNEVPFGAIRAGWAADIVALEGDLENDFEGTLDRVSFVMKAGKVFKQNGHQNV